MRGILTRKTLMPSSLSTKPYKHPPWADKLKPGMKLRIIDRSIFELSYYREQDHVGNYVIFRRLVPSIMGLADTLEVNSESGDSLGGFYWWRFALCESSSEPIRRNTNVVIQTKGKEDGRPSRT